MAFDLDGYIDVGERITTFREMYPGGSLQPLDTAKPYTVEVLGDKTYIVYVAAAYRTPDDARPGVGCAWETWPGTTNYTRNSELQNAETSAWGRAIVAALAADSKRIASKQEVQARQGENEHKALVRDTLATPAKADRSRAAKGTTAKADEADPFTAPAKAFDIGDWTVRLLAASSEVDLAALGAEVARARTTGLVDEDGYHDCVQAGKDRRESLRGAA